MKELVNRKITTIFAVIFAFVILCFNVYLLYQVIFGGQDFKFTCFLQLLFSGILLYCAF